MIANPVDECGSSHDTCLKRVSHALEAHSSTETRSRTSEKGLRSLNEKELGTRREGEKRGAAQQEAGREDSGGRALIQGQQSLTCCG